MEQRTQEERARIVARCVEIEKAGGDVLGYLSSEHYISPGATWHNMQKFDLRRTNFTDGKPTARETMARIQRARVITEAEPGPKKKRHPFRKDKKKTRIVQLNPEETEKSAAGAGIHPAAETEKQTEQETRTMAGTMIYQNEELAKLVVQKINDGFAPVKAVAYYGYKNPHEKLKMLKTWALGVGDNDLYTILNGGQTLEEVEQEILETDASELQDPDTRALVEDYQKEHAEKTGEEAGELVKESLEEPAESPAPKRRPLKITALEGEMRDYKLLANDKILIFFDWRENEGWELTPDEMEKTALEFFDALRILNGANRP